MVPSAHWLLAQAVLVGVVQAPAPLHTVAVVTMPLAQLPAEHWAVLPGKLQAVGLVPSHWLWQGAVPVQAARIDPRGNPATVRHLPALLLSLHAWHCPVQALSQQTPSTQWFELHSVFCPQVVPGGARASDPDWPG